MSPLPPTDGHDLPWSVLQFSPSVAAVVDDILIGFEDAVREPVFTDELPDVFNGIEFG